MRIAVLLLVLLVTLTACGEDPGQEASGDGGTRAPETCEPPTSGPAPRELFVQPGTVGAGDLVAVRLGGSQTVSPEAVSVTGSASPCRTFSLYEGELIEMSEGDVNSFVLSFESEVAFDIPQDAEAGTYTVCTVTPEGSSTVDACGSLTVP